MIRKLKETDIAELFVIFESSYPSNPTIRKKPFFDWYYKNSPYNKSDEYSFLIATSEDQAIRAFIGYIPLEFVTPNGIIIVHLITNWFSLVRGIDGILIIENLFSRFENFLMIGITPQALPIYQEYDRSSVVQLLDPLEFSTAVLDVDSVVNQFPETINYIDILKMSKKTILKTNLKSDLNPKYGFDENENEFEMQYLSKDKLFSHIRKNTKYLNWRYFQIPFHNYKMVKNIRGSACFYRIEKIMNTSLYVTHIVEWGVHKDDVSDILGAIVRDSLENNSILIDFQSSEISIDLENTGFIKSGKIKSSIPRKFRPIFHSDPVISAVKINDNSVVNFIFSSGDSDVDRIKL